MGEIKIKEISKFTENGINKTKMIITEDSEDKEIILEGNGSVKVAVEA